MLKITSLGRIKHCESLTEITIPATVTYLGEWMFPHCDSLSAITFESSDGWWHSDDGWARTGDAIDLSDPKRNVQIFLSEYPKHYFHRGEKKPFWEKLSINLFLLFFIKKLFAF